MQGRWMPGSWMGKLAPLLILLMLAAAAASLPQRSFAAGDARSQMQLQPQSQPQSQTQSQPHAAGGALQIGDDADAGEQKIALDGEWEFYWNKLLEPQDLQLNDMQRSYRTVPSSWDAHGYGTYRLLLRVPASDVGQGKALFIRSVGSAYRLWIDGAEMEGLGKVGTALGEERPQAHINMVFFQPRDRTVEIVMQVSNYSFREGGINRDIVYGDTAALIPFVLKELLTDIFVIGGFLMIGIYHLIIFVMRRREQATLWVGLLALAVSLRTLFINGYVSTQLLGIESWELLVKLEYMSEIGGLVACIFLMKRLYPQETGRMMVRISLAIACALLLFVALTPARVYTETMLIQTVVKAAVLLYFLFYVGVRAYLRKREGALIHLIALGVIVAASLNDMLYYLRLADTPELLGYSVVPFIMAQAIIVSYRYTQLSTRNHMLLAETNRLNAELEHKVTLRTRSLREANDTRTKMLLNIAHDLGTPLVGIQTYLQLMLRGKAGTNREDLTRQLLEHTGYMKRLVDDLFELSKLESGGQAFQFQTVVMGPWLEATYRKFEPDLRHAGITLGRGAWRLETEDGMEATATIDPVRIAQALQNYIDNAVKFSRGVNEAIELEAYVRPDPAHPRGALVIAVRDHGTGIPEEMRPHVFRRFFTQRENNEGGSGLGLAIVKEIVERHGGAVGVESEEGAGSTFSMALPLAFGAEAASPLQMPESKP
ncbi:ATP-binding protein [Cohnella sp. GCM10012308]|uniref:sensor histidine kinase n=1 Tax=Cohnella sp. GCM10012308 TaxID=3317329 RepID=UPI00360F4BB2